MARHNSRLEEYREKERQQREAVIAEFAAGDTEATLHAMAAEILTLPARRPRPLPPPPDIGASVGWTGPWAMCGCQRLFDHLISAGEQRGWHFETERSGRF